MPSLAIRTFSYDGERNELSVTFTTGKVYVYSLVPSAVAEAFAAAGSKGAFFNEHIRDRYPHRRGTGSAAASMLREALKKSAES